eukprot:1879221-Rhodomonas_salina.1
MKEKKDDFGLMMGCVRMVYCIIEPLAGGCISAGIPAAAAATTSSTTTTTTTLHTAVNMTTTQLVLVVLVVLRWGIQHFDTLLLH